MRHQIQYSADGGKTYKNAGTVGASKTSASLKLGTDKSYTFRIRSCKTESRINYNSPWSAAVAVN